MFNFQEFTPNEYVYIALANAQGLDKELWGTRIQWAKDNLDACLSLDPKLIESADEPMAFVKACHAMRDVLEGNPTGFIMGLDATNSGRLCPLR